MTATRLAGVPKGAVVAGSYGQGLAPVGGQLSLAPSGATLVVSCDDEWTPPLEIDPKHCSHTALRDDVEQQCRSWPVIKDGIDNPERLCVGHLKKANSGAEPAADQGLRTNPH